MILAEGEHVGRIWRQDGQTLILTFDDSGNRYWKHDLGWFPIVQDLEDENMVQIFLDGSWWRTYKTELEIQPACEAADLAFA